MNLPNDLVVYLMVTFVAFLVIFFLVGLVLSIAEMV